MLKEKRKFSRISFGAGAEVIIGDVIYQVDEIINLSMGGCRLRIKAALKEGMVCQVKIPLSGTVGNININIHGEINRSVPGSISVKFTRIDPDSHDHLKNIMRLNSPDAEIVEKEFIKHPGIL